MHIKRKHIYLTCIKRSNLGTNLKHFHENKTLKTYILFTDNFMPNIYNTLSKNQYRYQILFYLK
jgi:hypothetical protein